jgi:lipoprotein
MIKEGGSIMKRNGLILILSFIFILSACGTNENSKISNAIEDFINTKNWEYQVENNYYYPKEAEREVFVINKVKINHLRNDDYLTEIQSETKVVSNQKTEDISALTYDTSGKEVSSIRQQDNQWVKTVWTDTDGKVDLEINRIKDILKNRQNIEKITEKDKTIYRIKEHQGTAVANLQAATHKSYSIDFNQYVPYYLDITIGSDGNISEIDCSHSSYGYLVKIYTGAMISNPDGTFRDFIPVDYKLSAIKYDSEKIALPAISKTITKEMK